MPIILLPLLFLAAGVLGVIYFQSIPNQTDLRSRLPNRTSWAGIALTLVIGLGIWLIVHYASSTFLRIAGITTLLFYLLTFESILLLLFRWTKSNLLSVVLAAGLTLVPFSIQYFQPSYALSNVLIIAATLGATALIIRLQIVRTRIVMIMAGLLTINDYLNVHYVLPKLPLAPPSDTPFRLLILPTVNIGGHVVGSGDFMFLALTTVVLVRDFGPRPAMWHAVVQAIALAITLAIIIHRNILLPYLLIMTPIFLVTYIVTYLKKQAVAQSSA